ncbi:MAG: PEP-CTERM sorting domain-containing protein [Phycisphaerae bacterium]|nr:PEP-CTERM sorting domain-containing protein [Phycisphaerae bacterium]
MVKIDIELGLLKGGKPMRRLAFILSVLMLFNVFVQATPITIEISGVVTSIRDLEDYPYDEIIKIGDTFSGTYTYDSATANSSSSPSRGSYKHDSPYGFDVSLGGFEFITVESHLGEFNISVYNDHSLQNYDRLIIESNLNSPLSTGISVDRIAWSLYDSTHTAISSINLPTDAPDLHAWGGGTFTIFCGGGPNASFAIWGVVTHAELIPEPATLLLLGVGGLTVLKRRKL